MIGSAKKPFVSGQVSSMFRPAYSQLPSRVIGGYKAVVLADSPTAYWRLGEPSGTSAADASGNSHAGTYEGTPLLGRAGLLSQDNDASVLLNGSSQDVAIASVPSIATATTAFSVEGWFQHLNTLSQASIFCCRASGTGNPILHVYFNVGNIGLLVRDSGGAGITSLVTTGKSYNDGNKHHFAAVRTTGKAWTVYVDSVSVLTGTDGFTQGCFLLDWAYIGRDRTDGTWYGGLVDELAIYNGAALSSTRVAAHYNAGK